MPTDAPRGEQRGDPNLSGLETGDSVQLQVSHNTIPDRSVTVTVQRTTSFGGGAEVTARDLHGGRVKVYGDFYPPIVEQTDKPDGRLERIERE